MSETVTIGALWRRWRDELARSGSPSAALDAKLLTEHALGLSTLELAIRENDPAADPDRVNQLMERRLSGESVARIIGRRQFYGLDFILNSATLEPRPETELLVDLALDRLPETGRLLDLGTGTGCIPIAILANSRTASGLAIDLSPMALAAAQQNAESAGVADRLSFTRSDWFNGLGEAEKFDLIASNPPYITSAVVETLAPEVKDFDPRLALDGGPDGLAPYRLIVEGAGKYLNPEGNLLLEIGYDQGQAVTALLHGAGFANIVVHRDLNGLDRVVTAHHMG